MAVKVELRYASLPSLLRFVAVHYWFVVFDDTGCHRWEVWQTKDAGGRSIGHLHCDLKHPDAHVGGGPTRIAAEWSAYSGYAGMPCSCRSRPWSSPALDTRR